MIYLYKSAEALCLRRVDAHVQIQSSNQIQSTFFFTKLNHTIKSNTQSKGRGYPSPTPPHRVGPPGFSFLRDAPPPFRLS